MKTDLGVDWLTGDITWQVVGWLLAAALAVVVLWKGWSSIRKFVDFLARGVRLVDTLTTLPDDLATIKHEVLPNSGSSLKDATVRTEARVAALTKEVAALHDEVAHVRRQSAALKTSVAKTNRRLTEHIGPPADDENKTTEPRHVRGSRR